MTTPYALLSDIHFHAWSQFSSTNADGVNSRLQIIIDELKRAATEVKAAGGEHMVIAGDIFHVRGSIDPEVFNPVHEAISWILQEGLNIYAIPGNHDLKGRDTTEIGNAFQTLGSLVGFFVVTRPKMVHINGQPLVLIPWQATKDQLRETVKTFKTEYDANFPAMNWGTVDAVIHVGIDGVLKGVPDLGLSAEEVASWGFKRVFAGDYHDHKVMEDGDVISIGATTHQQWGDIDTKAGFLLVYPDNIEYRASHAPRFVELTGDDNPDEYSVIADGNYVRVRGMKLTDAEINAMRKELMDDCGARGVSFQVTRETVSARGSTTVSKAATLDESVDKYVDTLTVDDPDHVPLIKTACADVLSTVRSVAA